MGPCQSVSVRPESYRDSTPIRLTGPPSPANPPGRISSRGVVPSAKIFEGYSEEDLYYVFNCTNRQMEEYETLPKAARETKEYTDLKQFMAEIKEKIRRK